MDLISRINKNHILIILFLRIYISLAYSFFWIIPNQNKEIYNFKTEILTKSQFCESSNSNDVYSKRLENLEQKYIDVNASSQTINFWITIFSILIPLVLGVQLYQKGKFEEESRKELDKIRDLAEKTREKIENIDNIVDSKIDEILNKSNEAGEYLLNLKSEIIKELNELNLKYSELEDRHLRLESEYKNMEKLTSKKEENSKNRFEPKKQKEIDKYLKEGDEYSEKGNFKEALKKYEEIISIDSNIPRAHFKKGLTLSKLGEHNEAIKSFNKAIELDEINPFHYRFRANILNQEIKDYNNAIQDYEKYLELGGNNGDEGFTFFHLSELYSLINNKEKSIDYLYKTFEANFFDEKKISWLSLSGFDNIRETEEFKAFIKKLEEKYPKK